MDKEDVFVGFSRSWKAFGKVFVFFSKIQNVFGVGDLGKISGLKCSGLSLARRNSDNTNYPYEGPTTLERFDISV